MSDDLARILGDLGVKFDGREASSDPKEMPRRARDMANLVADDEVELVNLVDL